MQNQTVVRLARKTNDSMESTLEGILLNEITLSNMDYTEEKKWSRWRNDDTVILWCGKVSDSINLTALDKQVRTLVEALNFSTFTFDKLITNDRVLMTISIICSDENTLIHTYGHFYNKVSPLFNVIPLAPKNIVVSELCHYEFEATFVLTF